MKDASYISKFNKIYENTYNNVLKYIIYKCSNMEDVNDIIQETYLEFYNSLTKDKEIDDYNKYIIGIAKNKIKKYYNLIYKIKTISIFEKKKENIDIIDLLQNDIDIEKIIITSIDKELIWNYLKTKKIVIQKIFYLYYALDLKIKDISQELNVTESYTKNNLYRTLKELQELLGKDCD